MIRFSKSVALAVLLASAATLFNPPVAEARRKRTPMIRTVVRDSVTTRWTIDCLPRGSIDVTKLLLTEQGWGELIACIGVIERVSGVNSRSRTIVRQRRVVSDVLRSSTKLTEADVQKLKDIIETHELPGVPLTSGKPRIECERKDGQLSRFVIDPGDGRPRPSTAAAAGPAARPRWWRRARGPGRHRGPPRRLGQRRGHAALPAPPVRRAARVPRHPARVVACTALLRASSS